MTDCPNCGPWRRVLESKPIGVPVRESIMMDLHQAFCVRSEPPRHEDRCQWGGCPECVPKPSVGVVDAWFTKHYRGNPEPRAESWTYKEISRAVSVMSEGMAIAESRHAASRAAALFWSALESKGDGA